jgi:hypothetical protein
MMNISCNDRGRIFEDGTYSEWVALETHASGCPACAEELRAWKSLSVAAQELRDYSESPALWPRIERALAEEDARKPRRPERNRWFLFPQNIPLGWQSVAAGAFVLVLTISAVWFYIHRPDRIADSDKSLLRSATLKNVESAETAYVQAIDKLAAEASPQLDHPATPLLANYHEKLVLLDSAIAELRAQAGMNPSNAQLRYQLLAMYQEKQHTLEEVLEAKQR